ncbi:ATP-binding protein [Natranaerofaba carboxydovora]|uniref:ATP-binding protein n=1 Tax=Natranaerofaba carboxydovora TaxID=2742683 RepID=UPI001F143FC0|nr:ATP-binding protein [Natranaerofaba carboxydovora]UMZ74913.1 Histidine kinase-like ATPase domain protein [Natranaerofaba carboxydovora]
MKFEIKSIREELSEVRDEIESFLITHLYEEEEFIQLILIGLYEVMVNAGEHGNKFDPNKNVIITTAITKKFVKFTVEDEGEGFDWESILERDLNIENLNDRGKGVLIAKKCFDFVYYVKGGKRAVLIKLR